MKVACAFLIIAISIVATPSIYADEPDKICPDAVYRALGSFLKKDNFFPQYSDTEIVGSVVSSACKLWPYKQNAMLAAFAYDEGVPEEKTIVVAILDKSMKVTAHYKEKVGEGVGQTYGPSSFTLDTARYDLASGVRAFGLRFSSADPGASAADSHSSDYLTLFVQEAKTLRPVFAEYMEYQNALSGLIGYPTGHEFIESGIRTISISKSSTNGYADLIVTDTIGYDGNEEDRPPEINRDNRTAKSIHKYDGHRYR
jgi:hypothetical protein